MRRWSLGEALQEGIDGDVSISIDLLVVIDDEQIDILFCNRLLSFGQIHDDFEIAPCGGECFRQHLEVFV